MHRCRRLDRACPIAIGVLACSVSCASKPPTANSHAMVYVSNETQGTIVLVDAASGIVRDRITVGTRPRGLKVSPDGTLLYVALSGSPIAGPGADESALPAANRAADGIGVVDLRTRRLTRVLPSGQDPETFDVSPDGRTLYVSNEETAEMSIVDLERGAVVARVRVCGEPEGVTVSPDGARVYVTCEADGLVAVVDARARRLVTRVPAGARPRAVAVTPDGGTLLVTAENGNAVTVIDASTLEPRGLVPLAMRDITAVPPRPMGAVLSSDARTLFVSTGGRAPWPSWTSPRVRSHG